jgi:hypothetical protein
MPYQIFDGDQTMPWLKYFPIRMENPEVFDGSLLQIADKNIFGL